MTVSLAKPVVLVPEFRSSVGNRMHTHSAVATSPTASGRATWVAT